MREKLVAIVFVIIIVAIPIKTFMNLQQVTMAKNKEPITEETQVMNTQVETLSGNNSVSGNETISENGTTDQLDSQQDKTSENASVSENSISENAIDKSPESKSSMDNIKSGVDTLLDNIALKEEMAEANSKITAGMSGFTYIESNQVVLGKDNWLFYKDETDGTPLTDYEGTNWYTEEELVAITANLIKQQDAFAEKGIRFVVMIPPNKSMIYPEYMPPTIFRKNTVSKADKLVEYLRLNSDLEIVYPKDELLLSKDKAQIYFKYDSHWNDVGAFIGAQSLLQTLYGTSDVVDGNVETGVINLAGDLALLVNMEDVFNDDIEYKITSFNQNLNQGETILVVGDSFRDRLLPNLNHYFDQATGVLFEDFTMSMLDTFQPDVVVWECVERHTDRLLKESLISQ